MRETDLDGSEDSADGPRDFAATAWSQLLDSDAPGRGLTYLADRFWKPVYAFIRARQRCTHEDAKDLTQQFFLWMLESRFVEKIEEGRGRFRNFLKVSLRRFLDGEYRARHAQKRGGRERILSVDHFLDDGLAPGASGASPEEILDQRWREELLARAFDRLAASFEKKGKSDWIELWRSYELSADPHLDYAALARRHGLEPPQVTHRLTQVRQEYRRCLLDLVAETVHAEREFDEEIRDLFGAGYS